MCALTLPAGAHWSTCTPSKPGVNSIVTTMQNWRWRRTNTRGDGGAFGRSGRRREKSADTLEPPSLGEIESRLATLRRQVAQSAGRLRKRCPRGKGGANLVCCGGIGACIQERLYNLIVPAQCRGHQRCESCLQTEAGETNSGKVSSPSSRTCLFTSLTSAAP